MKSHPPRSRSSGESSSQRRKWVTLAWVALFSLPLLWVQTQQSLAVCPPTCGIAYTVDSTGDGHNVGPVTQCNDGTNHCTLRAAIEAAIGHAGDDGIFFDIPTTDPNFNGIFWTIRLATALPALSTNVNITGPGADKLTVQRSTVNGTPLFPIFNVTTTGLVTLSGMTIRNGIVDSGTFGATGGGIAHNASGTLNVANCILTGNSARNGGGIGNFGAMTVTHCTLSGNSASSVGGGIYSEGGTASVSNCMLSGNSTLPPSTNSTVYGGGLGIVGAGTVNVTNCALSGNQACGNCGGLGGSTGSAGLGGGIYIESNGTVNVTNCSLGSNSVGSNSGSDSLGGGICIQSGIVNIINSTLGGNFGLNGGGIYNDTTTLNVTNCTLSSNSAKRGGGIFNPAGKTANVKSSIIALNTADSIHGPDLNGTFIAQGFNLIGNNDSAAASFPAGNPNANNDIVGTSASPIDPKLDPNGLQNNGGPTQTIALLSGSPAIDKGTSLGSTGTLATDQRGPGYTRTVDDPSVANAAGGDGTDIGAFEFGVTIRLISIIRSGSDIVVTFDAVQGATYRLERKANMTDSTWLSISGVNDLTPSSNGPAPITDPNAVSLGKAFYRGRLL